MRNITLEFIDRQALRIKVEIRIFVLFENELESTAGLSVSMKLECG